MTTDGGRGLGRSAGFSLVEALFALALLSVALLIGLSLLYEEARITRRLSAHEEVALAMESALELVRSRTVAAVSGPWPAPLGPTEAAEGLVLWQEVTPAGAPNLFVLTLRARYTVRGAVFRRELSTMLWSP